MKNTVSAVIFAAGKGTRMLPLTETKPKPLMNVANKNLIEWKLELLPAEVTDIVLIIGYKGDQIREYFGNTWKDKTIQYIVQKELNGTAGALFAAADILPERFLVMMGDDLYAKEDVERMLKNDIALCAKKVENKETGGEILLHSDGTFSDIYEEKHFVENGLINIGMYMLDRRIFDYAPVPIGGSSTEFGLPHTLALLAKDIPVQVVTTTKWFQITTPEDLLNAENFVGVS
jgi:bifunctional UDP-N-acetylglucosamine pyrophosphorylase/glucosamine-1-phosphate N-acetyltransferase